MNFSTNEFSNARICVFALFFVLGSLASSVAIAQTTMQQQQAENGDESSDNGDEETSDSEGDSQPTATADEENEPRDSRRRDSSFEGPQAPGEDEGYVDSEWTISHMPGFRLDFGFDFDDTTNVGLGLGYMAALNWRVQVLVSELLFRGGIGPDLTFITGSDDGFDGATAYLTGRLTGTGPQGGLTIEGGLGWGIYGQGFVPSFKLGAFYAWDYFEIGYFYQGTVFDYRPDWITPHQLGFRLHIPLVEH